MSWRVGTRPVARRVEKPAAARRHHAGKPHAAAPPRRKRRRGKRAGRDAPGLRRPTPAAAAPAARETRRRAWSRSLATRSRQPPGHREAFATSSVAEAELFPTAGPPCRFPLVAPVWRLVPRGRRSTCLPAKTFWPARRSPTRSESFAPTSGPTRRLARRPSARRWPRANRTAAEASATARGTQRDAGVAQKTRWMRIAAERRSDFDKDQALRVFRRWHLLSSARRSDRGHPSAWSKPQAWPRPDRPHRGDSATSPGVFLSVGNSVMAHPSRVRVMGGEARPAEDPPAPEPEVPGAEPSPKCGRRCRASPSALGRGAALDPG